VRVGVRWVGRRDWLGRQLLQLLLVLVLVGLVCGYHGCVLLKGLRLTGTVTAFFITPAPSPAFILRDSYLQGKAGARQLRIINSLRASSRLWLGFKVWIGVRVRVKDSAIV
jgi:hypothetical protein